MGTRLIAFIERYERPIGVGALVGGFLFDTLTLGRPDQLFGILTLGSYLLICAGCIVLLTLYGRREKAAPTLILVFLQFCFGNLASGLLVIYGQSGTFEGSSLFFLVIGGFLIGNEFLRERYTRLIFHVSAWFLLLLGYSAIVVPVFLKQFGDGIFLLSVALSGGAVAALSALLAVLSPASFRRKPRRRLVGTLLLVALFFSGFYFFNILPPVPLSAQTIGIYHSVVRTDAGYTLSYEHPVWYEPFRATNRTVTIAPNAPVYCFSAVFAPAGLSTSIRHRWESYDEATQTWHTVSILTFPIAGGRYDGYRGYSERDGLSEGKWRCDVETERGTLIGRTSFTVVFGEPTLLSATL